jgi:hypothetical protein
VEGGNQNPRTIPPPTMAVVVRNSRRFISVTFVFRVVMIFLSHYARSAAAR